MGDDLTAEQRRLLDKVRSTTEQQGLAESWREHVPEVLDNYREEHPSPESVSRFVREAVRSDPELRGLEPSPESAAVVARRAAPAALTAATHADVLEADGAPMRCFQGRKFENWAQTVANDPAVTFVPRTKEGVCNLVKWAKSQGKRVRVAGYRHTWGDFFSADGQVLVSLLEPEIVEDLPAEEAELDPNNELQGIQIVHEDTAAGTALCRIGAATTNEMFREWSASGDKSQWKAWTLPLNVIMVEITYGGSNAPICHGAGLTTKTLSDLVAAIEFVNADGELQTVDDPDLLRTAAGCFGLLGVVTSLTLRLDAMSYARMKPRAPHTQLAIPPVDPASVPDDLRDDDITQAQRDAAWDEFVRACENDYYVEWFWFPYQDRCWVNTWKNDGTLDAAEGHPNELTVKLQETMEFLAGIANDTIFSPSDTFAFLRNVPLLGRLGRKLRRKVGRAQAEIFGITAMASLPKDEEIVAPMMDALHFQRGIHNMRVYDMELEIPIPPRTDDPTKPDWRICQEAWWEAIDLVYAREDSPMRVALELRITHDSAMHMAPQHGNQLGTCSIEVLTTENVHRDEWLDFMQAVADRWFGLGGNVRTHWAKQWQGLQFRGQPALQQMKQDGYAARLPEFKLGLQQIAAAGGYTLADVQARFSNPLLDDLFESVFA